MVKGHLILRIHSIEGMPQVEEGEKHHISGMYYSVRVTVGKAPAQTTRSRGKGQETHLEQDLTFDFEDANGQEGVIAEILDDQGTILAKKELASLGDFIEGRTGDRFSLETHDKKHTAAIEVTSKWQPQPRAEPA